MLNGVLEGAHMIILRFNNVQEHDKLYKKSWTENYEKAKNNFEINHRRAESS